MSTQWSAAAMKSKMSSLFSTAPVLTDDEKALNKTKTDLQSVFRTEYGDAATSKYWKERDTAFTKSTSPVTVEHRLLRETATMLSTMRLGGYSRLDTQGARWESVGGEYSRTLQGDIRADPSGLHATWESHLGSIPTITEARDQANTNISTIRGLQDARSKGTRAKQGVDEFTSKLERNAVAREIRRLEDFRTARGAPITERQRATELRGKVHELEDQRKRLEETLKAATDQTSGEAEKTKLARDELTRLNSEIQSRREEMGSWMSQSGKTWAKVGLGAAVLITAGVGTWYFTRPGSASNTSYARSYSQQSDW